MSKHETISEVDEYFYWLFNQRTLESSFDTAVNELSKIDEKLWQ